ncbi:MAG: Ig-like domain repeat protein [Chloroflexi bacterium]|nr:Ig-like domain repeat protein [Chloroflexota bacterium]
MTSLAWFQRLARPALIVFIISLVSVAAVAALPAITATKVDTLLVDVDGDGKADPGDAVRYTVVVQNTGDSDATGVTFEDTVDANTTLSGTARTTPLALADSYSALGNVRISVPAANGLLVNDFGVPAPTTVVTSGTSTQGGSYSLSADGSFTYDPPAGYEGADTFVYSVSNANGADSITVTINISGMIWFIDNTASAGDGRLLSPFNSLAAFNAVNNGTGNHPAANDAIFLYESATTYDGGITLLSGQRLIGQDATSDLVSLTGVSVPSFSAALPAVNSGNATFVTIVNTTASNGGNGVVLNANNWLHGFIIGNKANGYGLSGSNFGGLTVADVAVTGTGGTLLLNTGALTATFSSLSSTSTVGSRYGFGVQNASGTLNVPGGVSVSGPSSTAVYLNANSATFNFSGLTISTSGQTGLQAANGGTLNVTGAANTIATTNAPAIDLGSTTIGASGLTFRSVSANGGVDGIRLNNVPGGAFTITGSGSAGSGGTLQNLTGDGVRVSSASNVSLSYMNMTNVATGSGSLPCGVQDASNCTSGIDLVNATNVVLDNVIINGSGQMGLSGHSVNGLRFTNGQVLNAGNGNDEFGMLFSQLAGTVLIQDATISQMEEGAVRLYNNTGTLNMTVRRVTMSSNDSTSGFGEDGLQIEVEGTATATILVDDSTFTQLQRDGVDAVVEGTSGAILNLTVQASDFLTNYGYGGVIVASGGTATARVTVDGNLIQNTVSTAINLVGTGDSTFNTIVTNNTIAHPAPPATQIGFGIRLSQEEDGDMTARVEGNTISGTGYDGLRAYSRLGDYPATDSDTGTLHLTVRNNTVSPPLNVTFGADIQAQNAENLVCLNFTSSSNVFNGNIAAGLRVRQVVAGATFQAEGLTSGAQNVATMQTFLNANSTINPASLASPAGSTYTGVTLGTCRTPATTPLPPLVTQADSYYVEQTTDDGAQPTAVSANPIGDRAMVMPLPIGLVVADRSGVGRALFSPIAPEQAVAGSSDPINIGPFTLHAGKSITITFDVTIDDPFPAGVTQVSNQGTVSGGNFSNVLTDDPAVAGAANPTVTEINLEADLIVTKTDGQAAAIAGTPITYTVVARNAGPMPVTSARLIDNLPAALTNVNWTCAASSGANCNGSSGTGNLDRLVDLPLNGAITYTLQADVAANVTGTVTNTASITVPAGIIDPVPGNNTVSDTDTLTPQSDLVIAQTESIDPVIAGSGVGNLTYVITLTNQGPSVATNVVVNENLIWPAGVSVVSITPSAGNYAAGVWTMPALANGAFATLTVQLTVDASAAAGTDVIANTATVAGIDGTLINTGDDTMTVSTSIARQIDLIVAQTESIDPVLAGSGVGNLTYFITVTNQGPSNAGNISISEALILPAGVSLDTATPGTGSYAAGVWTIPALTLGAQAALQLDLTVGASAAAGSNVIGSTASVTGVNETLISTTDDSATAQTSVTRQIDLTLSQSESIDPVIAGSGAGNLTYVVTLTNQGPSDASGVTITDTVTLPAGVSVDSITPSAGAYNAGTWTLPALTTGAHQTLSVVLTVGAGAEPGVDVVGQAAAITGANETLINLGDDAVTTRTTIHQPPSVTLHPVNQAVCVDTTATFTSTASGFPAPTVQWQVNDGSGFTDIGSATATTYAHTALFSEDTSQYRAVFDSSAGTATSNAATLTVGVSATVTADPISQTVYSGEVVTFTAAASGTPAVQWQVNDGSGWTDLPGETSTTLSFAAQLSQTGDQYRAVFTTGCGVSSTDTATLTVNQHPTTTILDAPTVTYNANASITVTVTSAAGTPDGEVTLRVDGGTPITQTLSDGATTFTLISPAAGPHSLTVNYLSSGPFAASLNSGTLIVNRAASATTLASAPNPALRYQTVTLTATVTSAAGTPTGSVTFYDAGSSIGSGSLSGGVATFNTSALSIGAHTITATYGGDGNFNGSTSNSVNQVVNCLPSIIVTSNADSGAGTLRQAIADVCAGGTITFDGDYTITLDSQLTIGQDVTINGGAHTVTVTGNDAVRVFQVNAAVVFNLYALTVTSGNCVTCDGGGMNNAGTANVANSTFVGNNAQHGGAVYNSGTLTVTNSTFGSNGATDSGGGLENQGDLLATNSTFAGNSALVGGNLGNWGTATATLRNSLLVKGAAVDNCGGLVTVSGSNNLADDSSCGASAATSTSILLGTLGDYGGSTPTFPLLPGSPAINAGNNAACSAADQRGVARSSTCDIGAFESRGFILTISSGNAQHTPITTAFAEPLIATVLSLDDEPLDGGRVIFTAPASGASASPLIYTATITSGAASASYTANGTAGTYTVHADAIGALPVVFTLTNDAGNSATTLTSAPNPSVFGQSVTFTATVSSAYGVPTGVVTFTQGAVTLGTGNLSGGVATVSLSTLNVGDQAIAAEYGGDTNFYASIASAITHTVNRADTATTVTAHTPQPSIFGQTATFTATVSASAPGAGAPTGTITFFADGNPISAGTLSGAAASVSYAALSVGDHAITAQYNGDSNFNLSISGAMTHTVDKAETTTSITSEPDPSVVGQSIAITATITANAPGAGVPGGTVIFYNSGLSLGSAILSNGAASLSTNSLAVGAQPITATYSGDTRFNASSGAHTHTVDQPGTTTVVSAHAPQPSIFGQAATFTATVSVNAPGAGTPTGSVTFFADGNSMGTGTLSGNSASISYAALTAGDHAITAHYGGDSSFVGSTSTAITHTVNKADTTTAITAHAPQPSIFGQVATFTATVTTNAPGSGTPIGSVSFYADGNLIGTSGLSGGLATINTSALNAGDHAITAAHLGGANFATSTSGAITHTVNKADTATGVAAAPEPSTFGQAAMFTATVTTDAPGNGTPTGSITFTIDAINVNVPLDANGQAAYITDTLLVGAHAVSADYSGAANFNVSSGALSGGHTVIDTPIADVIALNSSPTRLSDTTFFTVTATGSNITYEWDFGDSTATASGATADHVYAAAGAYTARITATNGVSVVVATTPVSITNLAPLAAAGADQAALVNALVTLDGTASGDLDGHLPLAYLWQQTGGSPVTLSDAAISQPTFTTPAVPQVLTFTLIVTDAFGAGSALDEVVVLVDDRAITDLDAINDGPLVVGNTTHLTATIGAGSNALYVWDFGDGQTGSGAQTAHRYERAGFYTATVTATNGAGSISATTVVIIEHVIVRLPLVMNRYASAPDLVVEQIIASGNDVQVVIKNRGDAPVLNEFWVDVYINPTQAPTGVNQTWPMLGEQGLTWGVTADALPALKPGGVLTLTLNDAYYFADLSNVVWPLSAGTLLYAQADSADATTTYGAVCENHEFVGLPYNNIYGPVTITPGNDVEWSPTRSAGGPITNHRLPRRP